MSKIDRLNAYIEINKFIEQRADFAEQLIDEKERVGYWSALRDISEWLVNNISYYKNE